MVSPGPVAESKFFADPGTGVRRRVRVQIFTPRRSGNAVFCRVRVDGVLAKPIRVFGEDTMQAVALSVRFVNNTLRTYHRQGWRYYCERSDRGSFAIWQVWGHSPRIQAFEVPRYAREKP